MNTIHNYTSNINYTKSSTNGYMPKDFKSVIEFFHMNRLSLQFILKIDYV